MTKNNIKNDLYNCWILDYKPSFKNLIFPKLYYSKILNLVSNKTVPMNIMLIGLKGTGKFMLLKCILKYCYNIEIAQFKPHSKIDNIYIYESLYLIDFIFTKKTDFKILYNFIKITNKTSLIQINNIPKIIILKNIDYLDNENINKIFTIIKQSKTIFIVLSRKNLDIMNPAFNVIRIKKLNEKELKYSINKLLKSKKIDIKNTLLTYKKIYKTYNDSFYNIRDTILWIQHTINSNNKPNMHIKNKMIASLLNSLLSDRNKMSSNKELEFFNKIYNKLILLMGCGIDNNEILKYTIKMLLQNKLIENDKKREIVKLASIASIQLIKIERPIFALQTFFNNLMILFT